MGLQAHEKAAKQSGLQKARASRSLKGTGFSPYATPRSKRIIASQVTYPHSLAERNRHADPIHAECVAAFPRERRKDNCTGQSQCAVEDRIRSPNSNEGARGPSLLGTEDGDRHKS